MEFRKLLKYFYAIGLLTLVVFLMKEQGPNLIGWAVKEFRP